MLLDRVDRLHDQITGSRDREDLDVVGRGDVRSITVEEVERITFFGLQFLSLCRFKPERSRPACCNAKITMKLTLLAICKLSGNGSSTAVYNLVTHG